MTHCAKTNLLAVLAVVNFPVGPVELVDKSVFVHHLSAKSGLAVVAV
jgi:hypothetical protein